MTPRAGKVNCRAFWVWVPNVEVQGRGADSSRSVPWNDGFGVLGGKLDDLERFTPLLGVPQVVLHLLAKPTLGAGVKGDG